jgi:digeranylgeranylglycerophospholipid reductase
MKEDYDVVIAGGSVSGLLTAREIAASGCSVLVLEEDSEIGTPEHCGGLVSINGIRDLGILPWNNVIENQIKNARICSPSKNFELNTQNQKIMVVERRIFDKLIAVQAGKIGAEIRMKCSFRRIQKAADAANECFSIETSDGKLRSRYFVDARGVASLIQMDREGVLQSAQYEVYAPWIEKDTVIVNFDNIKYPGFFAWIIPTGEGIGKVGVAGRSINAARTLMSYMQSRGENFCVIRKVFAPIWIKGPINKFVTGRIIVVGDAAGQTKPTTAGGIYSCGLGGILAGRAIVKAIEEKNDRLLQEYETNWANIFRKEFKNMLLLRNLFERLDNKSLDTLFSNISQTDTEMISISGDFDFHAITLVKVVGLRRIRMLKAIIDNEIRRFL